MPGLQALMPVSELIQQRLTEANSKKLSKRLKGNIWSDCSVLLQRLTEAEVLGIFPRNISLWFS